MAVKTLPKNITDTIATYTKRPWNKVEDADRAADYIRELRLQAHGLGALTEEELDAKRSIDAKLAAESAALADVKKVEDEFKPHFIAFTQAETARINATLPVSKQRKFIEGKGWKVQLSDKPASIAVTNNEAALKWLEKKEPEGIKIVRSVDMSVLSREGVLAKLKKMGAKISEIGIMLTPTIPDGNSSVKVKDLDVQ